MMAMLMWKFESLKLMFKLMVGYGHYGADAEVFSLIFVLRLLVVVGGGGGGGRGYGGGGGGRNGGDG